MPRSMLAVITEVPSDLKPTHPIVLPPPKPEDPPLIIWGPPGPWVTPPIYLPPIDPGGPPVVIWPGPGIPPEGQAPLPEHPIYYPPGEDGEPPFIIWGGGGVGDYIDIGFPAPQPPPVMPDLPPAGNKPPPPEGGWGCWNGRWGYFPGPGEISPKT